MFGGARHEVARPRAGPPPVWAGAALALALAVSAAALSRLAIDRAPPGRKRSLLLVPSILLLFSGALLVSRPVSSETPAIVSALAAFLVFALALPRTAAAAMGRGPLAAIIGKGLTLTHLAEHAAVLFLPVDFVGAGPALSPAGIPASAAPLSTPPAPATPQKAPSTPRKDASNTPRKQEDKRTPAKQPRWAVAIPHSVAALAASVDWKTALRSHRACRAAELAVLLPVLAAGVHKAWPRWIQGLALWYAALSAFAAVQDACASLVAHVAPSLRVAPAHRWAGCPWAASVGAFWAAAGGGVLQSAQALVMEAVVEGSAVRVAVAPKDGGNGNIIGRVLGALAGPFSPKKSRDDAVASAPPSRRAVAVLATFAFLGLAMEAVHCSTLGRPSPFQSWLAFFLLNGALVASEEHLVRFWQKAFPAVRVPAWDSHLLTMAALSVASRVALCAFLALCNAMQAQAEQPAATLLGAIGLPPPLLQAAICAATKAILRPFTPVLALLTAALRTAHRATISPALAALARPTLAAAAATRRILTSALAPVASSVAGRALRAVGCRAGKAGAIVLRGHGWAARAFAAACLAAWGLAMCLWAAFCVGLSLPVEMLVRASGAASSFAHAHLPSWMTRAVARAFPRVHVDVWGLALFLTPTFGRAAAPLSVLAHLLLPISVAVVTMTLRDALRADQSGRDRMAGLDSIITVLSGRDARAGEAMKRAGQVVAKLMTPRERSDSVVENN